MHQADPDVRLMLALRDGDASAFDRLFGRWAEPLLHYLERIVPRRSADPEAGATAPELSGSPPRPEDVVDARRTADACSKSADPSGPPSAEMRHTPAPKAGEAMAEIFEVKTTEPKQCIDITHQVEDVVRRAGVGRGLCHVMVLHATAAIVVNENDDPNIGVDVIQALDRVIPDHGGWLHDRIDDNAHAHIKAALLGPSETIPIEKGDLLLGRWQGIMLMEFDGPRDRRRISVQIVPIV